MERLPLIGTIIDALAAHQVRYVLIGGAAMMLHGSAYMTRDIDICYERTKANIDALVAALSPFKPQLRLRSGEVLPFRWDAKTIHYGENFTLSTTVGDVDILGSISGFKDFAEISRSAAPYKIGSRLIPMMTIDGLVVAKRAAGRQKDLLALPELEAMAEAHALIQKDGDDPI